MNYRPDALYIFRLFSDTGCVLAVQEVVQGGEGKGGGVGKN